MIKKLLVIILAFFTFSCEEKVQLPTGFEHVSVDGRSHFVYVSPEYMGEKVSQREAGRTICTKIYLESDYCEVYYFSKRSEVPTKFPIINRLNPIGYFEVKGGKEKFKVLTPGEKTI